MRSKIGKHSAVRQCRDCGCTDRDCRGCIERTGQPCCWVRIDLCSACVPVAMGLMPFIQPAMPAGAEVRR